MGGFGSGWKRTRRTAVEDGIVLDPAALTSHGLLTNGSHGKWEWRSRGKLLAAVGYVVDLRTDPW